MSTEITQITTPAMMTKHEAQEIDAQIIELTVQYMEKVGPIALEMQEREGWRVLGFKNWTDYCKHVDERISGVNVARLAEKAYIERNVQAILAMRHALVLRRLPSPEAQRKVYQAVKAEYEKPIELNFETYVDKWLRENQPDAPRGQKDSWTKGDLEEDSELAEALERIEKVYGHADRKAIQHGTIGLSRKDIIALSAFHASKMKEVHYLIMANHWDVATAMKFVNKQPDSRTMIEELKNHCLATVGFYYTCSVEGFDISIRASNALTNKTKAQANGLS